MNEEIQQKLTGYEPQRHTIAIYTPTADLARWLAQKLQLTSRQWFYVQSTNDLFGRRDVYLIFYGDFFSRDDFDEIWDYWKTFMPPDCQHYLLENEVGEDNGQR